MSIDISMNSDQLKDLVQEAILRAMDENQRETLIQAAIRHLLTSDSTYGRRESPIQHAFNSAVNGVAILIAKEQLEANTEVSAKMESLIQAALVKVMDENREKTIERIAAAITDGLAYRER